MDVQVKNMTDEVLTLKEENQKLIYVINELKNQLQVYIEKETKHRNICKKYYEKNRDTVNKKATDYYHKNKVLKKQQSNSLVSPV
jgi:sarcosine oxidase delta subunit